MKLNTTGLLFVLEISPTFSLEEASMVQWNWIQPVYFLFLKSAPNKVQKKPVCFSEASETAKAKNNSTEQLSLLPDQTLNRQSVFRN